ncbi:MAG: sigma-70 family RNA polymerase sigma factor [Bacilli bacterium]|nr:sigma-70 family RNA polymerase sigma factor [Bacilli bacterium]
MNKLIKLILQFKECENCNQYSNDILFEEIYIELKYLIKSYICKVPIDNRDDFKQELLSCLYKVLQVFKIQNNVDNGIIKNIKVSKTDNINDIIKIYNNKYFKAFVNKYKQELQEVDFNNLNNIVLLMDEFNLFCNENQFIKYLIISFNNNVKSFNDQYRKEQPSKPISLNLMINDEIEYIDLIKDETKNFKIFDENLLSKKDKKFLSLFLENNKILKGVEVASKLGITQQAVSIRLKRIREKYYKIYNQIYDEVEI